MQESIIFFPAPAPVSLKLQYHIRITLPLIPWQKTPSPFAQSPKTKSTTLSNHLLLGEHTPKGELTKTKTNIVIPAQEEKKYIPSKASEAPDFHISFRTAYQIMLQMFTPPMPLKSNHLDDATQ